MSAAPEAGPRMSPLEMALNLTATVQPIAEAIDRDPIQAVVLKLGDRGHAAAQMAAYLALVSIAQDLHALRAIMLGAADQLDGEEPPG